jgi:hypothetical protein
MTQAAHLDELAFHPIRRSSRAELLELAVSSGAVDRFIEIMGGPPEFDRCDDDDIREFIRENTPVAVARLGESAIPAG